MKKKRIASALLSGAMLMSMCCFGASAADSEHPDIIFGDLNLDSSVNLLDAITSQKYVINSVTLDSITAVDESLLDINQDGKTNLLDTIALQKHLINTDVKDYIGKIAYEWITEETVTEEVWVVDKPAYTYEEDVYQDVYGRWCNDCGADLTDLSGIDRMNHCGDHLDAGGNGSWRTGYKSVKVGTETVTVPEEGHYETQTVTKGHYQKPTEAPTEETTEEEKTSRVICNDCNADLTDLYHNDHEAFSDHLYLHVMEGGYGSYRVDNW